MTASAAVLPQLPDIDRASTERVIRVLADDDMEGHSAFSHAGTHLPPHEGEMFEPRCPSP